MVNRLGAGTKVGQLGIWNGTEWVAGDPDCNIVKWGGTALTARDITTLLDHLNVDLSTRALEAGGNLAALVTGMNTSKWGGTALTGRDITSLLDHLNIDLDTRAAESGGNLATIATNTTTATTGLARLQPWYQPNFTVVNKTYIQPNIAPHGWTQRWLYTVPAGRIAKVMAATICIMRDAAPTAAGFCTAALAVAGAAYIPYIREVTSAVGIPRMAELGESTMLLAGQTLEGYTQDSSNGGSYTYNISVNIMEFNT